MNIGGIDLAILLGYMLAVVLFGMWVGRRPGSLADYVVGGRNVPWWVVLLSIVATETSTVTFLSIPGVAFGGNLTWLQLPMGYVLGRLVVVAILLPHYFSGRLFTAYEVLRQRFGGATSRVASVLFLVMRNLADGLRLFLTALVLQEVAGIQLGLAVLVLGVATILYTVLGGMKAVVWTDAVQFVVYVTGAFVALDLICAEVPFGFDGVTAMAAEAGKLEVLDFGWDVTNPYLFWSGILGGAFLTLGTHGTDQMMVQRYLCARSQRAAAVALSLSGVVVVAQFALFLLIGTALWAYYQWYPAATVLDRPDRVFAGWIVRELPPGVLGLLLGAVFSAAMSTLSSSLNSSATTAVHDLFPARDSDSGSGSGSDSGSDSDANPDPRAALRRVRRWTVAFGLVQIAVGIGGQGLDDSIVNHVLAIAGFTTGIVLGVFFLGVLTRRVGEGAALIALVTGLAGMTAVKFGTDLAWPWFALTGSIGTFLVGLLASYLLPRRA